MTCTMCNYKAYIDLDVCMPHGLLSLKLLGFFEMFVQSIWGYKLFKGSTKELEHYLFF